MPSAITGGIVVVGACFKIVSNPYCVRSQIRLWRKEQYLKELVGYIHLNPLRARIVVKFKDLAKYPYCGHRVLVGKLQNVFQDVEYVLRQFGNKLSEARHNYREFVRKRIELGN